MSDLWYQDTPADDLPSGEVYGFSAGDMTSGGSDWGDVAKYGISRLFDVAKIYGQTQLMQTYPLMQNGMLPNGQPNPLYAQQSRTNTMLLLIAAGVVVVMLAKK